MKKEEKREIYSKRTEYFQRSISRVANWNTHPENQRLIREFQQFLFAQGRSKARISKLSTEIKWVCENTSKPLTKLNHKDVEAIVSKINQNTKWSKATKEDYVLLIKQFYKWYEDEDPRINHEDPEVRQEAIKLYKYLQKNLRLENRKKRNVLGYTDIINDKEADIIINKGCRTNLEKAIISILHSTGVRVGELLGMRIKDVEIEEKYGMIRVDGKTGERRIPILKAIPHLLKWIEEHPQKDNPDAYLWTSKSNKFYNEPLKYMGIVRITQKTMNRSGLNKKCNPHWFRHSRATIWATDYSEVVLCKLMGWTLGSEQVKTYVHLGASQVKDAFLKQNGIIKDEKQIETQVQECVCGTINEHSAKYCFKCGKPLSVKVVLESQDKIKQAEKEAEDYFFKKIANNPEFVSKFMELLTKMK